MANSQVGRSSLSQQNKKKEKRANIWSPICIPTHRPNGGLNNPISLININLKFVLLLNSLLTFVPSRLHK